MRGMRARPVLMQQNAAIVVQAVQGGVSRGAGTCALQFLLQTLLHRRFQRVHHSIA